MMPIREAYRFTSKPRGVKTEKGTTVPFLPMEQIPIGRVTVSTYEERSADSSTSGTYIENGDLLVAKITPSFENGKQAIVDWDRPFGYATTEVIPIQEIKGLSDKRYLFHVLLHPEIRSSLAGKMDGTTGRQRLSKETLGNCIIPVPPLATQHEIAAILGQVQKAIEEQERLLALTSELKRTLLHRLFTQGLRGESQKQTEIGPVPESWAVCKVGDVAKIQSGGTPSRDNPAFWQEGSIPWVKTGEIDYCVIRDTEEKITPKGLTDSVTRLFPAGTLLMAMYGQGITRGRVALLDIDAATNQACAAIMPHDEKKVSSRFLYYFFEYHYEDLRKLGHGANQRNMNAALIRSFPLVFPSAEEQAEIVASLSALDAKQDSHHRKHATLSDLFRTLLHQLMTGQVYVA